MCVCNDRQGECVCAVMKRDVWVIDKGSVCSDEEVCVCV